MICRLCTWKYSFHTARENLLTNCLFAISHRNSVTTYEVNDFYKNTKQYLNEDLYQELAENKILAGGEISLKYLRKIPPFLKEIEMLNVWKKPYFHTPNISQNDLTWEELFVLSLSYQC